MEKLWKEEQKDGFRLIRNEGGKCLGLSDGSRVKLITVDGLAFKDFLGTGELAPYDCLLYTSSIYTFPFAYANVFIVISFQPPQMNR